MRSTQPADNATSTREPSTRRERVGWYFYDWANSAFATTVLAVFLGPYLTTVTKAAADANGFVYPLGIPVAAGAFFPYTVSLSALLQVLLLPILGAIADYTRLKKRMMGAFAYLGAFATMGFYFLEGSTYILGGALFLLASVSFAAAVVMYHAFLPEISTPDNRDGVSSTGWALGYAGGGLLLALNLGLYTQAASFGLSAAHAARISLASAGLWWAVFTVIPLLTIRTRQPAKRLPPEEHYVTVGFRQLGQTLGKMANYPQTLLFLAAYLIYNDGIQTAIAFTTQFGQEELGIPVSTLTAVILMVQFIAFFGALFFGFFAQRAGTRRALITTLVIWTAVSVYAFAFMRDTLQFTIVAGVVGIILGGSQALSRSAFSQMIPKGQEAEYFSFYEVSERGTSWLGPLFFGLALQFTGSYRAAILSVALFFLVGLLLLVRVNIRRAAVEAGNEPPARL